MIKNHISCFAGVRVLARIRIPTDKFRGTIVGFIFDDTLVTGIDGSKKRLPTVADLSTMNGRIAIYEKTQTE